MGEIGPIEPGHATNAYKTCVKSTFSISYDVMVELARSSTRDLTRQGPIGSDVCISLGRKYDVMVELACSSTRDLTRQGPIGSDFCISTK